MEKLRIAGNAADPAKVVALEGKIKDMKNKAAEQLQDGHLAAVAAHNVQELSNNALSQAVQGMAEKKAAQGEGGSSSMLNDKMDKEKKAEVLMDDTKKSMCDAATKTEIELNTKSKTLNALASTLYDAMEKEQKGSNKEEAASAQEEYEKAADNAYSIGQAYSSAQMKMAEACGTGAPKEVEESVKLAQAATELKVQAREAAAKNDTKGR